MKNILYLLVILCACSKSKIPAVNSEFTNYTIQKGKHYCDQSSIKAITVTNEMKFAVVFDSSCVYTFDKNPNQYDVNKLYGFSDGGDNHINSARIGWSWNNGALHLYAYSYDNGVLENEEITTVPIGQSISCSIALTSGYYVYTVSGVKLYQKRTSQALSVTGYQQYPYFGGDEVAPQLITIKIKS